MAIYRFGCALVLSLTVASAGCRRDEATAEKLHDPTPPMLQQLEPDSCVVVWELRGDGPAMLVLTEPDGKERTVPMERTGLQCIARIDGLLPGTAYPYRVSGEDAAMNQALAFDGTITTPEENCNAFRFAALGDSGGGGGFQLRVEWCMRQHDPDLIIHTGDLVYLVGAKSEYPFKFFGPYGKLIPDVPFYPVLGNHDTVTDNGAPLLETFVLPENGPESVEPERCYWFDYCNARFVALDTNLDEDVLENDVAPWLAGVLADAQTTWKFVFFHHAVYTNANHAPNQKVRNYLVPVFEAGGVDIAFSGHNHLYERTYPIKDDQVVGPGEGVVYVTTGAGGMSLYIENEEPVDYMAAHNDEKFSFTLVDIDGPRLTLRQINDDNNVFDEWVYDKTAVSPPASSAAAR